MTAQLQVRNNQNDDLVLQDIENTQRLCASLMKTPHYAKMGEVGIFAIVQKARSVGMSPLDALNGGITKHRLAFFSLFYSSFSKSFKSF